MCFGRFTVALQLRVLVNTYLKKAENTLKRRKRCAVDDALIIFLQVVFDSSVGNRINFLLNDPSCLPRKPYFRLPLEQEKRCFVLRYWAHLRTRWKTTVEKTLLMYDNSQLFLLYFKVFRGPIFLISTLFAQTYRAVWHAFLVREFFLLRRGQAF